MEQKNKFIEKLLELKQLNNYSNRALAKEIGVTPSAIDKYLTGEIKPRKAIIQRLADYLHYPVEYFNQENIDDPISMLCFIMKFNDHLQDHFSDLVKENHQIIDMQLNSTVLSSELQKQYNQLTALYHIINLISQDSDIFSDNPSFMNLLKAIESLNSSQRNALLLIIEEIQRSAKED